MKIIHYTLRRDRTPNSVNCRRHRFDRSWESDKCVKGWGRESRNKKSYFLFSIIAFFLRGEDLSMEEN